MIIIYLKIIKKKKCKIYKCNFFYCISFVDMLKYIDKRYLVISLNIFTTDKELALNNHISNNRKNSKIEYFPTLEQKKLS